MFQRLLPKTGSIRPRVYGPQIYKNAPDYSLAPPSHPIVNSKGDITGIMAACKLAREVLDLTCSHALPGVTAESLDIFAHNLILERNAYPSPLGYKCYPRSICTSVNNVMCHGIPDNRKLVEGDMLNIDVSVYLNGFHGDCSKMVFIGNVDSKGSKLINSTREALQLAIELCKPFVPFSHIGNAISEYASKHSFSPSPDFCGHGIGRFFHQPPLIIHTANDDNNHGVMIPGMIFTIEPILCEGDSAYFVWPDKWTCATVDGGRAAQFEHTILITSDGATVLTS